MTDRRITHDPTCELIVSDGERECTCEPEVRAEERELLTERLIERGKEMMEEIGEAHQMTCIYCGERPEDASVCPERPHGWHVFPGKRCGATAGPFGECYLPEGHVGDHRAQTGSAGQIVWPQHDLDRWEKQTKRKSPRCKCGHSHTEHHQDGLYCLVTSCDCLVFGTR